MSTRLRNLFDLSDTGKRVYFLESTEVAQEDYEYGCILSQIMFGPTGLTNTLGPTWAMVMDPRFAAIENLFIIDKPAKFGGDARQGLQRQGGDGTFDGGFSGLQQYAQILGDGRFLHKVVRSIVVDAAIQELYPAKKLWTRVKTEWPGLEMVKDGYHPDVIAELRRAVDAASFLSHANTPDADIVASAGPEDFAAAGVLNPEEKAAVKELAAQSSDSPANLKDWSDDSIWGILREYYPNYFNRQGRPNQEARTLKAIIAADLVGLIDDFAEVPNIDEVVLLHDNGTLYEPGIHGLDADRVSAEVEMLERALDYRAEMRVLAARILAALGADRMADGVELTDRERDELAQLVFAYPWPEDGKPEQEFRQQWSDEKPKLVTKVLSFLFAIKNNQTPVEVRFRAQLEEAGIAARAQVAALKDGSLLPITRYTDGVVETPLSDEDAMLDRTLRNPLAAYVFLHWMALKDSLESETTAYRVEHESGESPAMTRLGAAAEILRPVIHAPEFNLTEDEVVALMVRVQELVAAKAPEAVAQYEGYYPALTIQ